MRSIKLLSRQRLGNEFLQLPKNILPAGYAIFQGGLINKDSIACQTFSRPLRDLAENRINSLESTASDPATAIRRLPCLVFESLSALVSTNILAIE